MPRHAVSSAVAAAGCLFLIVTSLSIASDDDAFNLQPRPTTTRESRFSRSAENEIRFQQGLFHYNDRKLPQAEEDFRALVGADPNDANAWYYLGLSELDQYKEDKLNDAINSFNRSITIDPSADEVYAAARQP